MIAYRIKILLCALLAGSSLTAFAQRVHRPALRRFQDRYTHFQITSGALLPVGRIDSKAVASRYSNPGTAIGNAILAKQRGAKFMAERGITFSPARFSHGGSPAQVLAQSRARYRQMVQQLAVSGAAVPAWQPLGPAQVI